MTRSFFGLTRPSAIRSDGHKAISCLPVVQRRSPRASVAPVTTYARVKIAELIDAALTNPTAKDCGVTDHQRAQVQILRQQMDDIVSKRFDVNPGQEGEKP